MVNQTASTQLDFPHTAWQQTHTARIKFKGARIPLAAMQFRLEPLAPIGMAVEETHYRSRYIPHWRAC